MSLATDKATDRWRGRIDATLETMTAQLEKIGAKQETTSTHLTTLDLKVQAIGIKMAIYSGVAAIITSSIMSIIVALIIARLNGGK